MSTAAPTRVRHRHHDLPSLRRRHAREIHHATEASEIRAILGIASPARPLLTLQQLEPAVARAEVGLMTVESGELAVTISFTPCTLIGMAVFEHDEERESRWIDRFVGQIRSAHAQKGISWRAAAAGGTVFTQPLYPIGEDIALRWVLDADPKINGALHWARPEPDGGAAFPAADWFPDEREQAMATGYLYFEDHPDAGDGVLVLSTTKGSLAVVFGDAGAILPLRTHFLDYIELQIELLGMSGLLELLVDLDAAYPKDSLSEAFAIQLQETHRTRANAFRRNAATMFPAANLSVLNPWIP